MSDDESPSCGLCNIREDDQLRFGQLFQLEEIAVHHFCLLFSPHMQQNGKDDEGAEGFLEHDIKTEIVRAASTICSYCNKGGATSHCMSLKCSKKYHVGCVVQANGLLQFFGKFKSFCEEHRPRQNVIGGEQGEACSICLDQTDSNDQHNVLWTPCCKHFFHRACLQRMAYHFGYFFYCPGCRNKDSISGFLRHMRHFGIFIPKRDASWEMVPNAFGELLERHLMCDVRYCLCVQGRQHQASEVESPWRLCVCETCGSAGTHLACSDLPETITRWVCPACTLQPEAPSSKCTLRTFFDRRSRPADEGSSSGSRTLSGPLSLHEVLGQLEEPEQLVKFTISPISGLSVATRRLAGERTPVREPGGRPVQYHPLELLPEAAVTADDQRQAELRLWSENHVDDNSEEEDWWSTYDAEKHKMATPMSIRRPTTGCPRRSRDKKPAARPRAHTSPVKTHRPGPACSKWAAPPAGSRATDAAGSSGGSSRAPAASHAPSSRGGSRSRESSVDAATVVDGPRHPASASHVSSTSVISEGPVRKRPCEWVSGSVQPRNKSYIPHSSAQNAEQTESDDLIIVEPPSGSSSGAKAQPPTSRTTSKPAGAGEKTPVREQRTSSGRLSRKTPAAYVELSDDSDCDDPKAKSDGDDVEDVTPQKVKEAYTTPYQSVQQPGRKLVQAPRNRSAELFPSNPNPPTVQKEAAPTPNSAQSSSKGPDPEMRLINRARAALFGYPCPICEKQHQTLTQVTLHYYTHDVGESLFRCKICSATFSYWQPGHVRSEHPHVKPDEVFSQMENRFEQGKRNVAKMILEEKNIDVGDLMDHVLDASSQPLKVGLATVPEQQKEAGAPAQPNQQRVAPDKKSAESTPKEQTIEQLREEYQRKRREKELKEEQQRKTLEELRRQYQNKQKADQRAAEQKRQQQNTGVSKQPGSTPLTKTQELLSGLAKVRAQEEAKRNEEKAKRDKLMALKSARIDKSVSKPLLSVVPNTGNSQTSRTAGAAPMKPSQSVHGASTPAAGSSSTTTATEKFGPQRVLNPSDGNRRFNTVQCVHCNFRGIAAAVKRHAVWHSPQAERRSRKLPHRCTRCFYASSVSSHVQIHLVCVHFIDSTTAGARTPPGSIDPSPMSEAAWKMARSLGVKTPNDGDKPSIGLRRFDCAFCDCFFMDQAEYHTHFQQWHIKPKGWNPKRPCPFENCFVEDSDGHSKWYHKAAPVRNRVCSQCGGTIYEGKEKQHKMASCHSLAKVSEQLHFECPMPICGFGSNDQEEVTVHLAQCHSLWIRGLSGSRIVPYRCPRCGDAFEYKKMKDHVPNCTKEPPPKQAEQVPGPAEMEIDPEGPVRSVKQEPISHRKPMVSIPASVSGISGDTGGSRKPALSAQKRPYQKTALRVPSSDDEDDPDIDREMGDIGPRSMPRGGVQVSKKSNAMKDDPGEMKKKIVLKKEPAAVVVKSEKDGDWSEDDAEGEEHVEMTLGGFMGMTEYKAFVEGEDDGRDINGKYRCIFCPAVLETEKGLSSHRIGKHKSEIRAAKMFVISCVRPCGLLCPFCGFTARPNHKWRFLIHLTRHSFGVPLSGLPDYIPTKPEPGPPPKKQKKIEETTGKKPATFQCMTCLALLPDIASLEVHVRDHARKRQCDPAPQTGSAKRKVKR